MNRIESLFIVFFVGLLLSVVSFLVWDFDITGSEQGNLQSIQAGVDYEKQIDNANFNLRNSVAVGSISMPTLELPSTGWGMSSVHRQKSKSVARTSYSSSTQNASVSLSPYTRRDVKGSESPGYTGVGSVQSSSSSTGSSSQNNSTSSSNFHTTSLASLSSVLPNKDKDQEISLIELNLADASLDEEFSGLQKETSPGGDPEGPVVPVTDGLVLFFVFAMSYSLYQRFIVFRKH